MKLYSNINKKYLFNYIVTSDFYFDFLILQLIASVFVLLYVTFNPLDNVSSEMVTSIEFVLSFMYLIDLILRRTIQKTKFMNSIWNIFDVVFFILIFLLTIIFNILELHKNVSRNFIQDQDMLGFLILSIRYFFQITRTILIFYRSRNIYNIHKYSQALQIDINVTYNSYKDSFAVDPFKNNMFVEYNSFSINETKGFQRSFQRLSDEMLYDDKAKILSDQTEISYM